MILQVDIDWPVALPLPFLEYSGEPRNGTLVSPTDAAAISRRSRFERSYTTLSVAWVFTDAQYQSFKTFFATTLGNGTAQFAIELRFPLNSGLTEWSVRIEDGYTAAHEEGMWRVQATLDLVNPVLF